MFFLSTSTEDDMDVNHRGGPPGFVRIISPTTLAYPEYSGNRLYQSLGNLMLDPKIGLVFPDYETGDVVYITGTTEILASTDASALLPGSNLAVKITISECRYVKTGLSFRGTKKTPSPYNPLVRTLATEGNIRAALSSTTSSSTSTRQTALLTKKEILTPSIARFTFFVDGGLTYRPGQWIALDFSQELDVGYEHMRDEDPGSLNDDFVRTFTISSTPAAGDGGKEKEFEITIRKVGAVTNFLFQQNERAGLEVGVLGVGGEFKVESARAGEGKNVFVAGGVGVTPLFGQIGGLELQNGAFVLLWAVRGEDVGLVLDTFKRYPGLGKCAKVFLTGRAVEGELAKIREEVKAEAEVVVERRMVKSDVQHIQAGTWYVCAGKGMRKEVTGWLEGQKVVFEDFDY